MDLAFRACVAAHAAPLAPAAAVSAWAVLAAIGAVVLALLVAERRFLSPRRILTPEDVATSPGRRLKLRAWVERDLLPLWDPPLSDVAVTFTINGVVHIAGTDLAGLAEVEIDPLPTGIHVVHVEAALAASNTLIIDVSDKPAFVVDLDHTIADCSQALFLVKATEAVRAYPGAADTLKALGARYRIIYLTARDHLLRDKTRDWLRLRGFPGAPLIVRRERLWSKSAVAHKRDRLAEIEGDVKLAAGIGDLATDVAAYESRKMKAIRFGNDVTTWAEVAGRLP